MKNELGTYEVLFNLTAPLRVGYMADWKAEESPDVEFMPILLRTNILVPSLVLIKDIQFANYSYHVDGGSGYSDAFMYRKKGLRIAPNLPVKPPEKIKIHGVYTGALQPGMYPEQTFMLVIQMVGLHVGPKPF